MVVGYLFFSSDHQVDLSPVTVGHAGEAIVIFHALSPTPFSQIWASWLLVVFFSDRQVDFSPVTGGHGGEAIGIFYALSPTPFSQTCW